MQIYETVNSVYYIDTENLMYKRSPKILRDEPTSRLTYGEWHNLKKVDTPYWIEDGCLRILEETSTIGIRTSPIIRTETVEENTK